MCARHSTRVWRGGVRVAGYRACRIPRATCARARRGRPCPLTARPSPLMVAVVRPRDIRAPVCACALGRPLARAPAPRERRAGAAALRARRRQQLVRAAHAARACSSSRQQRQRQQQQQRCGKHQSRACVLAQAHADTHGGPHGHTVTRARARACGRCRRPVRAPVRTLRARAERARRRPRACPNSRHRIGHME